MAQENISFTRRLIPLIFSQFFGVFNDNAFKMFIILCMFRGTVDYFNDSAFLFILTTVYVLPFLLLCAPAGSLSDRMPKRSIMILGKIVELAVMILGTLCLTKINTWGVKPLLGTMFLMTAQSAFFSPAFNGILPETFSSRNLSRANGYVGMVTFAAAIIGAGTAPLLCQLTKYNFLACGEFLCTLSIIGFFISVTVLPVAAAPRKRNEQGGLFRSLGNGWKAVTATRGIFITALGDAYFVGLGVAVQTLTVMLAKFTLNASPAELTILLLAPAAGMGIGCFLCGHASKFKIELGYIPFGALGLSLFLPLAAYYPGVPTMPFAGADLVIHPYAVLYLFLAGISGGFLIVPVRTYFQQRVNPAARGSAMAVSNFITFGVTLLVSAFLFLLVAGSAAGNTAHLPAAVVKAASHLPSLTPPQLFLSCSVLTLLFITLAILTLPDFTVRVFVMLLTNTLYKVRISGAENIPDSGPVLLVSNHASFVDAFIISACTSRLIRFLMHEDYYNRPFLRPLARFAGFIKVPRNGVKNMAEMFETVKKALRNGEAVCVFPEGKISKNGLMDEFRGGYSMMLPEEMNVPVIPVRIGMIWGSIFTNYYQKDKLRIPKEIPHPVSVTFGKKVPGDIDAFELRQKIAEMGADTEMVPRAKDRPLHYQMARNAKRHPFRVLISDFGGKDVTTFKAFVGSAIFSRKIRKMVDPECEYVGVMLPNCAASAIASCAVMMADKVPAILNFTASKDSVRYAIKKAKITHILTSRKFVEKIKYEVLPEMVFMEDIAGTITSWDKFVMIAGAILLPHQEFMNIISPVSHRDVMRTAAVLFSSGSTGIPKGVMLSHHNFNSDIHSFINVMNFQPKDVMLGSLPLFHAFGMCTAFWLPVMVGCKVVYVANPLDCEAIGKAMAKHKVTILLATPTFMQAYMRRCTPDQFSTVRLAIAGAEKLRVDISEKFDKQNNGARVLIEGYGCTELSPIVAINIGSSIEELGRERGKEGSIGPAMPGICARIVDPVTRRPLPHDTEGLLEIKGANVMQGYLGEPQLTADAIHDGWYNTGDIGTIDVNGYITLCGRISRFSKIGGEMVPHELVECTINEIIGAESKQAVVASIPDSSKGEALIVIHTAMKMTPEEIVTEMRARNITNLWIPKAGNFYEVPAIPMLGSGKLDLAALRQMAKDIAANGKITQA
ncbi:MAG: MFS transporter [Lentisphaeria bacterium]|nr:MFS transporter [Lentisphaeria bacterium]